MLNVLNIVGTRPEAIKMAPVIQELNRQGNYFRSILCATGQHHEMVKQIFDTFDLQPEFDLAVMQPNQSLASLTSRLIEGIDEIVIKTSPNWIVAQGDTTSVLAASLVAHYRRVPFAHVEAGLRTGDKWRPFPEEMNRCLTDKLADLYFAPTERNRRALIKEGVADDHIVVTGNTVVDALQSIASETFDYAKSPLKEIPRDRRLVLVTAHRRESFGETFYGICRAIRDLAFRHAPQRVHFVYPVHLNPNVRTPVWEILGGVSNISLLEPLDYVSLVHLMKLCQLALSDSGGIQEEAPSLGLPLLVLRDTSERPEGIEAGVARLVGTTYEQIVTSASLLINDENLRRQMIKMSNPYGDGNAAKRIVEALHVMSLSRN